ncbi:MAG TPA: hypothetical protein VK528_11020, partial [Flavobacterium sp.]|nr:hypothetical protein [Flavobacterium sp.]
CNHLIKNFFKAGKENPATVPSIIKHMQRSANRARTINFQRNYKAKKIPGITPGSTQQIQ